MLAGIFALTLTAAFAGAAIYVSVAEQPARLKLDDQALLTEWQPSYKRGAIMQASMAILCGILGIAAWWQTDGLLFLLGAVLILLPWPWTIFVMLPTNKALQATKPEHADANTRALVVK